MSINYVSWTKADDEELARYARRMENLAIFDALFVDPFTPAGTAAPTVTVEPAAPSSAAPSLQDDRDAQIRHAATRTWAAQHGLVDSIDNPPPDEPDNVWESMAEDLRWLWRTAGKCVVVLALCWGVAVVVSHR